MDVPGLARRSAGAALALLSLPVAARAIGVDGVGQRVVVPLVTSNLGTQSVVTVSNPGPEPIAVKGIFVGAEGTVAPASNRTYDCETDDIPPHESLTRRLRDLCPGLPHDGEVLGYLSLASTADARPNFFATSVVELETGKRYGVAGQPVGAFDPGFKSPPFGLHVAGLRTLASHAEVLTCYVGALNEPKNLTLELRDAQGSTLGSAIGVVLAAERMEIFDVEASAGLPWADRDDLSVVLESTDGSVAIAGCGPKLQSSGLRAYQAAQTAFPADRARLRFVAVEAETHPGPFKIPYLWDHTALGSSHSSKITLTSYLRPDDEVRCKVVAWVQQPNGIDTSPYLELRIVDPQGNVIGGGSGIKDTGAVRTKPLGTYPSYLSQRHLIEISYDEDAPWPHGVSYGGWGLECESSAGMSEPVPVPVLYTDNF